MAASGILFILFVLLHMYGNLKAFSGHDAYNTYAEHLRTLGEPMLPYAGLLWVIRVVLILSLVVHVTCAVVLAKRAAHARPVKYQVKKNLGSSFSSRTMRWGGLTLFVFIVWHLLHFTIVKINPGTGGQSANITKDPYELLVHSFDVWWMTVIYLIAMVALGLHLHHGTFSSLQTLGLTNSATSRRRARLTGWVIAVVIARVIHLKPLLSPWLLIGLTPTVVGVWLVLR